MNPGPIDPDVVRFVLETVVPLEARIRRIEYILFGILGTSIANVLGVLLS